MLFKGAQLVSQTYSQGIDGFLVANLNFSLKTNRECGIYFTQHIPAGELLAHEDDQNFKNILLEEADELTGGRVIMEVIKDMIDALKEFRINRACSVIK
jgi:hypothetical protein